MFKELASLYSSGKFAHRKNTHNIRNFQIISNENKKAGTVRYSQETIKFRATRWSKVDSAFHPPEVDKMSTRIFWELSGKK